MTDDNIIKINTSPVCPGCGEFNLVFKGAMITIDEYESGQGRGVFIKASYFCDVNCCLELDLRKCIGDDGGPFVVVFPEMKNESL